MTELRNSQDLALFARNAFSFLERKGFVPLVEASLPWFTISYTSNSHPISFSIGAFLPRYEYYVSVDKQGTRIALDEVAGVLELPSCETPNWTWAHSDPTVFRQNISYSAELLRRLLSRILEEFTELHDQIENARAIGRETERMRQCSLDADIAFKEGRMIDALRLYRMLPSLTKLQQKRVEIAKRG